MAFLKRNLFYIILVVVTILVCGGIYFYMIAPKSKENTQLVGQRVDRYRSLSSLGGGGINDSVLEAEKALVEKLKESSSRFQESLDQMNKVGRDSLVISIADGDRNVEFPAFPVDRELYMKHSVQFRFVRAYKAAMEELFERLNSTTPPGDVERQIAIEKMRNYMKQKIKESSGQDVAELALPEGLAEGPPSNSGMRGMPGGGPMTMPGGGAMTMPGGGGMTMPGMTMPGMTMPGDTGGRSRRRSLRPSAVDTTAAQTVEIDETEVVSRAINNLLVEKVESPRASIFAEPASFYPYPLPEGRPAKIEDMWKANVSYWIHSFVVNKILEANKQLIPQGQEPVIANAAVKRLICIDFSLDEDSRASRAAESLNLYAGETSPASGAVDAFGGMGMGMGMGMGGGDVASDQGVTLTGRQCTSEYDVINFKLRVVLAADRLLEFQRQLIAGDFCTIQKVELFDPYSRGFMEGKYSSTEYYYGPQPVVEAEFTLEFLMFTEWERAMMPVEMIKRLPPDAIRPEDQEKIDALEMQ